MRKYRKWRDILIEQLADDPGASIGFLQAIMEDYQVLGNPAAVMSAVRAVVESQGGIAELAKKTGIEEQTLSDVLSSEAAPRIDTLQSLLNILGCRLSIEPLAAEETDAQIGDVAASTIPVDSVEGNIELATENPESIRENQ